ncbi:MAG: yycG 4 [Bacillales bacterium]|jgi:signal transduction histidine kinase|nr:yycG 4 [Bacillales bacterium]
MTIRRKLLISYVAIIIVPCLLFSIAILALFFSFAGKDQFINPVLYSEQAKEEHDLFSQLKLMTTSNPEQLLDTKYLDMMSEKFNNANTSLLVRINNDITYYSDDIKQYQFKKYLAEFGKFKKHSHDSIDINEKAFKYEQHDFYFPNNEKGSIFVIKEASAIEQFTSEYFVWLLLLLLIILIITNGLISYLVSKDIIFPLTKLKEATEKIKNGQLNFEISTDRNDEIGALSTSFEEMRIQLQKSVELQIKYEENRKLLLSNISHDLKTPITSIKGYIEGVRDGIANSPEKLERYTNTIYKKANEMDAMIDELFLLSKLDLKRVPFNFSNIDIVKYIKECTEDLGLDYKDEGVTLLFKSESMIPITVKADQEKLMRVFTNIISNSVKYMDKADGQVTISIIEHQDNVEVTIADNGPGISKETLPYIFEQFYRADDSRNSDKSGSGLGLAIAKQIIEEHGGQIWANPSVKLGTDIHFTLCRSVSDEKNINN